MQFIVRFSENVDFFDSTLDDSSDKNVNIMFVDRHIYYRNVFFFTDRLKNLKKKISILESRSIFSIASKVKHRNERSAS